MPLDLDAAEPAWRFTPVGHKAFADPLRQICGEMTLRVQDADQRARVLALRCEDSLDDKPLKLDVSRSVARRDDELRAIASRVSRNPGD
jgi:hypothetical protein